jgi:hypothetical protein
MAHLRLTDAVNAPKALLKAVGVPGEIIVDHQVRPLQVDTLAGSVGRHQHAHVPVVQE